MIQSNFMANVAARLIQLFHVAAHRSRYTATAVVVVGGYRNFIHPSVDLFISALFAMDRLEIR